MHLIYENWVQNTETAFHAEVRGISTQQLSRICKTRI